MSKIVKANIIQGGRPIIFDFMVDGEVIVFEAVCPNCGTENLLISIDKTRITCDNPDCLSRIFKARHETKADMSKVEWKLDDCLGE